MDRYGLTRSTGVKGRSPDDDAAEGVPRTHEDGSVSGHWEEHTRDEVLVLICVLASWRPLCERCFSAV